MVKSRIAAKYLRRRAPGRAARSSRVGIVIRSLGFWLGISQDRGQAIFATLIDAVSSLTLFGSIDDHNSKDYFFHETNNSLYVGPMILRVQLPVFEWKVVKMLVAIYLRGASLWMLRNYRTLKIFCSQPPAFMKPITCSLLLQEPQILLVKYVYFWVIN